MSSPTSVPVLGGGILGVAHVVRNACRPVKYADEAHCREYVDHAKAPALLALDLSRGFENARRSIHSKRTCPPRAQTGKQCVIWRKRPRRRDSEERGHMFTRQRALLFSTVCELEVELYAPFLVR